MIETNLLQVRQQMEQACLRSGRSMKELTLIGVSKTQPLAVLNEAYGAGIRDFGENKVQEILEKAPAMPADAAFHMIGHLQRNKVKQLLPYVSLIHSVDSFRLAEQIQEIARSNDQKISILLEVNVAREDSKFGFFPEEIFDAITQIYHFSHLKIQGLMTIAPFVSNPEENREFFRDLKQLSVDINRKNIDNVSMSVLSMGMTGDYEVAIEEGATIIRIGTGIFGVR